MSSRDRILFVDDEPSILLTLPAVLEGHGFEVTTAATVSAALAEIRTSRFDVLLSDLNISEEGDGFRVVRAMRSAQPRCVTVILTGYPALESALKATRGQVDDYLIKPADVDTIIQLLRQKLASRRKSEA
jgi:DNA-binding NtrC family response regulator